MPGSKTVETFSIDESQNKGKKHNKVDPRPDSESGCRHDSIDGLQEKIKEKIHRHRYLQVIVFIIILLLDIADLVSDWLFYTDVSIAEQGLVYGLPDEGAVISLLVFSIIGTITFIFEVCNLGKEIFTGKAWFNVDLVSAVIIWIEDIPQISINVYISLCREDPISAFQLTKAAVVILGILIRIIVAFIRYCSKASLEEAKQHTKTSCLHVTYRVFIVLGLILNFAGAVSVFFFTQTQRAPDGTIYFEVPDTIFSDRYNDERYFHNVSVYFHHPTFDELDSTPGDSNFNWMRLITINSIRNQEHKIILFDYEYQHDGNDLKMVLWENDDGTKWVPQECYTLKKTTKMLTRHTGSCDTFLDKTKARTSIIFQFRFIPPDRFFRRLVFGDIKFNVKINENGTCTSVDRDNITDSVEGENGNRRNVPVVVHYYRTNYTEANHIIVDGTTNSPRFYRNQEDLIDIIKVWETGWLNCETKGSLAPHVDLDIIPPCVTSIS